MGVRPLIDGLAFNALLADKAFDANWLREDIIKRGAQAVIPPRKHRKTQINYDAEMYKWRHLVENYFARIKEFRGIATRYDKTDDSFSLPAKRYFIRHSLAPLGLTRRNSPSPSASL